MQKLKRKYIWIKIIGIVLLFSSCAGTRSTVNNSYSKSYNSAEAYKHAVNIVNKSRTSVRYNATIEYNNSKRAVTGFIKSVSDSVLIVNIVSRTLGMEIVKLKLTTDSLFFYNRMEKSYYEGDFKFLNSVVGMNVNLYIFEDMLLGLVSSPYGKYDNDYFNNFVHSESDSLFKYNYRIDSLDFKDYSLISNPNISHNFGLDKSGLLHYTEYRNIENNNSIRVDYSDFINNQAYSLLLSIEKASSKSELLVSYKDIKETVTNLTYRVPKGYSLVE